jgi:hypothetical protein
MTTKEIGGPAFPIPLNPGQSYQGHSTCDGMTLRDYFAAKAMQGMLAHPTRYKPRPHEANLHWHTAMASEAYEIADAMLAVREFT